MQTIENFFSRAVKYLVLILALAAWETKAISGNSDPQLVINQTVRDDQGNIFAAGVFVRPAAKELPEIKQAVLIKYDDKGKTVWTQTADSETAYSEFNALTVLQDDSVAVVGYQGGGTEVAYGDKIRLEPPGENPSAVILVYSPDGVAQWAKAVEGSEGASLYLSVFADEYDNLYAAGYQKGTGEFTFGESARSRGSSNDANAALVKYTSAGEVLWAKTPLKSSAGTLLRSVAGQKDGFIYVSGYQAGADVVQYGENVTISGSASGINAVIVKLTDSGEAVWGKTTEKGSDWSTFHSVAFDPQGNVYAAGFIADDTEYQFGDDVSAVGAAGEGAPNAVLVKYDADGSAQWARTPTQSSSWSEFQLVTVDADGRVYVSGYQLGSEAFGYSSEIAIRGENPRKNKTLVAYDNAGKTVSAETYQNAATASQFAGYVLDYGGVKRIHLPVITEKGSQSISRRIPE